MSEGPRLSQLAGLIGDPTRSEILLCLMDGRSFPVSELAAHAHVSVSTASHHLDLLLKSDLVRVLKQGRHRYYGLTGNHVAELIEHLGERCTSPSAAKQTKPNANPLANCRVCYNHLAGRTAVDIRRSLEEQGFVIACNDQFVVTSEGKIFLSELGFSMGQVDLITSRPSRACLDWTERLSHIGGTLGQALFEHLIERKWITKTGIPRQIQVTTHGSERIQREFPIDTRSEWQPNGAFSPKSVM